MMLAELPPSVPTLAEFRLAAEVASWMSEHEGKARGSEGRDSVMELATPHTERERSKMSKLVDSTVSSCEHHFLLCCLQLDPYP